MNDIIRSTGEYMSNFFKGENGTWSIVSTEGTDSALNALDTFRNQKTGDFKTIKRSKVYDLAEKGIIYLKEPQLKINTEQLTFVI